MIEKEDFVFEQIGKLDEDCIALVCYADVKNLPKQKAEKYMTGISDALKAIFGGHGIKILVLPNTFRIELLQKTKDNVILTQEITKDEVITEDE